VNRRDAFALLGGALVCPLAAHAQQEMPVVGLLSNRAAAESTAITAAFKAGLAEAGFVEGKTVAIAYAMAEDHLERLPALAAGLVGRRVAVISASGGIAAAKAAIAATKTIPIVFTNGTDPIKFGLVKNLQHPGGNVTGVSLFAAAPGGKRLGLLHELVPNAASIAVLADPSNADAEAKAKDLAASALALGVKIETAHVRSDAEFEPAIAAAAQRGAGALFISNEVLFTARRDKIVALAARYRLPASYAYAEFAAAGGLMTYGPSRNDGYRQSGLYVGRILKGEKPGDMPVLQPEKFELVINRRTATTLGLDIPPALLTRADKVIE